MAAIEVVTPDGDVVVNATELQGKCIIPRWPANPDEVNTHKLIESSRSLYDHMLRLSFGMVSDFVHDARNCCVFHFLIYLTETLGSWQYFDQ